MCVAPDPGAARLTSHLLWSYGGVCEESAFKADQNASRVSVRVGRVLPKTTQQVHGRGEV